MNQPCGPILGNHALLSAPRTQSQIATQACPLPPRSFSLKRSLAGGAFLLVYLAVYLSIGFAGVRLIEHAWSAIFR